MAFWNSRRHDMLRWATTALDDTSCRVQAACLLPLLAVARRICSLAIIQTGLSWLCRIRLHDSSPRSSPQRAQARLDFARHAARIVDAAAVRGITRANCLDRSLALWCLLRRRGIPAELRLGARPIAGGIRAHAWIELDGRVVNDLEEICRQFAPFPFPCQ